MLLILHPTFFITNDNNCLVTIVIKLQLLSLENVCFSPFSLPITLFFTIKPFFTLFEYYYYVSVLLPLFV